jgi:hypothetical protein
MSLISKQGSKWLAANGNILEMAGKNKFELPGQKKWQVKFYQIYFISFAIPQLIYIYTTSSI